MVVDIYIGKHLVFMLAIIWSLCWRFVFHSIYSNTYAHALQKRNQYSDTRGAPVERKRLLQRIRGVKQPVLAERRPGQLHPNRQSSA